ncbi:hypothetical protein [Corynebacterium sp. HMSC04H06]|uniref:hypothetical protein n=1 Tax=Corynebacterium sp. HMSC04H06 TaxID=1581050 RepID=UPI0008B2D130|nr:hypothetical protein [Corynebacterium sp. HMSC04H06]OFS22217.1 hypothetical protein HMPREF3067_04580 [Corynebacterium sp. HMSC04H06]
MKRGYAVAAAGAVAAVAIAVPVVGQSFGEDESESVPAQKVGVTVECAVEGPGAAGDTRVVGSVVGNGEIEKEAQRDAGLYVSRFGDAEQQECRQLPRNESSGAYDSTGEPI